MGIVYLLSPNDSDRTLVIKTLQPQYLGTDALRERFREEARLWVELGDHPNVVRAWFVDDYDGYPYIDLRFADAGSLRDRLENGRLSLEEVVIYGMDFCRGMNYCREQLPGFVHNDIKPENSLMISYTFPITENLPESLSGKRDRFGLLQLSDFGLARFREQSSLESPAFAGTLPYMAPEVLKGEAADYRSDAYSFGVMLYEMVSGRWPYEVENASPHSIASAHISQRPVHPGLEEPMLERIVLGCLDKTPSRRPDFDEIYSSLATLLDVGVINFREQMIRELETDEETKAQNLVHQAVSLDNLGDWREALRLLEKAVQIDPTSETAWHSTSVVLARQKQLREALDAADKAIEFCGEGAGYFRALCHMIRGSILSDLRRSDEATDDFRTAAEMDPDIRAQLVKARRIKA